MQGPLPGHRVRGNRATISGRATASELNQDKRSRDALEQIHEAIVRASRERPLSRLELRIRCLSSPKPWLDLGLSYSGWHRRRRKAKQQAARSEAAQTTDDSRQVAA